MALRVIEITELADARVDAFRNVRDADLRGRDKLFMAESELVLRRLLGMPARLHSILLSRAKFATLRGELEAHLNETVPIYVCDIELMHEIAAFHIHRGVLAAGFRPRPEELTIDAVVRDSHAPDAGRRPPVTFVFAEGVTNVDNMGALFRNAAAFGVRGVILDPTCCDPLYRKAIRVSMGHALSMPYAISSNWQDDLIRVKQEWEMSLIAVERCERSIPIWQMPRAARVGLVFGSEGSGISGETLALCDAVCEIPMSRDVPSINVAVASAVALYELTRSNKRHEA